MNLDDKDTRQKLRKYSAISHVFKNTMAALIALCVFFLFGSLGTIDYSTYDPMTEEETNNVIRCIVLSVIIGAGAIVLYRKSASINEAIDRKLDNYYKSVKLRRQNRLMRVKSDWEDIEALLRDIENANDPKE